MPKVGRREEILNIACKLFSQKGYHGTTIRDISDACGILSGSLYAHINTKEDLLFEITDRGAQAFLESLRPIVESEATAEEKLKRALKAHIQVIEQNLEAATVFFHEWKALTNGRRDTIQEKRDQYEALWGRILSEGAAAGEFADLDEKFARLLILSVGNWLYQWYRPGGDLSAEEISERFADMMLKGFRVKKGEGKP
ncbi:TetR/AcrR family transcriptional regulator [Paenactinomyces guangxiensis]|uniref:TetR/AcrR family transcriptional regulator n=2 Tax=Paenactinomyces guangxiensis TaxID=1490290 RepID=A0A7W1WP08_9BACL|nr:TetR/AcrR family transcriptional regulator [Paenactinomyces guangxiensis]MBA4493401.1 TetR/AcrR family transcriptional regulator [Paenactinomyces guangxiensis]MBH8590492.1 TetR family transcriptional regulator [Paenactinomyces guangxiensis]